MRPAPAVLLFLTVVFFLHLPKSGYTQPPPVKPLLTLFESVRRAETFIAQNGYTNAAPSTDPFKLELEWTDRRLPENFKPDGSWNFDAVMARRKGSLEPTACGWRHGGRFGPDSWQIVFRYLRNESGPNRGRAVWVSGSGDQLHIVHEDAIVKKFFPFPPFFLFRLRP